MSLFFMSTGHLACLSVLSYKIRSADRHGIQHALGKVTQSKKRM